MSIDLALGLLLLPDARTSTPETLSSLVMNGHVYDGGLTPKKKSDILGRSLEEDDRSQLSCDS